MNSSPDSVASMDEIVFVPLMIDESEPPSRLRSYRRKPKHPQKLSTAQSIQLQQHTQQLQPPQKPEQHRRGYFEQSSSSESSGEQSSGESQKESLCFYFGEQPQNSFRDDALNSFSSTEDRSHDESSDEKLSSGGELSYSDLTSETPGSPKIQGGSSTSSTRELFVPAPNGDGYYILTTTSPTPLRNDPVQPKVEDDDGGFSIYDNMPLDDADDDEEDDDGILTANEIIRRTSRSPFSSRSRPRKLKILTMEMGGGDRNGRQTPKTRPKIVETTVEISEEDIVAASTPSSTIGKAVDTSLDGEIGDDLGLHANRQLLGDWIHCGQCERIFDTENRMRRHMKLVHGPKSFSCPECSKSFTQYGHMQVHLRTVHTSAKPFECYVCHRRFNVSSNRNRHQRLHFTKGSLHFVPDGATIVVARQDRQDEANEVVENKEA